MAAFAQPHDMPLSLPPIRRDRDHTVVSRARGQDPASNLQKLQYDRTVARITNSSVPWKTRCRAVNALANLGQVVAAAHVDSLVCALYDWNAEVRLAAINALKVAGKSASTPHAKAIIGALRDPNQDVRFTAARVLRASSLDCCEVACASGPRVERNDFGVGQEVPRRSARRHRHKLLRKLIRAAIRRKKVSKRSCTARAPRLDTLPTERELVEVPCRQSWEATSGIPPEKWGMQLKQLIEFHDDIFDESNEENLAEYCKHHSILTMDDGKRVHVCHHPPHQYGDHRGIHHVHRSEVPDACQLEPMCSNMHAVVQREVKPRTKPHRKSFALMQNPEGLAITAFITHTWDEPFSHFVGTLRMALTPEDVVWVCSFALDQNADIKDMLDTEDLLQSPFAMALKQAPKLVVTLDEELKVPHRSWCAFEIERASLWSIPTFLWPYHLSNLEALQDKVARIDIKLATATDKTDQERIHRAIKEGCGYDAMNQRLSAFMGDRLRFYQAAIHRHQRELDGLSRQMQEAQTENDKARLQALEADRHNKLRFFQEEADKKAAEEVAHVLGKTLERNRGLWRRQSQDLANERDQIEQMEQQLAEAARMNSRALDQLAEANKKIVELESARLHDAAGRQRLMQERSGFEDEAKYLRGILEEQSHVVAAPPQPSEPIAAGTEQSVVQVARPSSARALQVPKHTYMGYTTYVGASPSRTPPLLAPTLLAGRVGFAQVANAHPKPAFNSLANMELVAARQ